MLVNLKSEMWKRHVTGKKLAELLGLRPETISDKTRGKAEFTRKEMFLIWHAFFKDLDMAFLFEEKK